MTTTAPKRDKRWLVAGVGCALVFGLGAGLTFADPDTLANTFSSFGFLSPGESLANSSLYVLRSFGVGSLLFGIFGLVVVNNASVLYTTSLAWTLYKYKLQGNNHYDEVIKDKIVLGAIPLKGSRNHLETLSKPNLEGGIGITGVVCLLEQHEVRGDYFFQPVQPEEWKSKNVKFLWLKTQDYEPVHPKALIEGADFIHDIVDNNGGKVYVHCKAGRGRSSACVVTYLVKYHNMSVDDAFKSLKKYRKQVHLNSRQLQSVRDAAELIKHSKKD